MTLSALARVVDIWVLAVGACLGSFLNVVIARLPAGRSIVKPRSSCPKCGKPIAWYDNVPLLSWLLLRGKCRHCGQPISPRYPLIELLTALLCFAVWRRFGPAPAALGYVAFVCALVALTWIDVDTWLLPHQITWPLLAVGLLSPLWNRGLTWVEAAVGAAAGFALFAAIALVGEKLLEKETMGWGDVWLLSAIGAWLGWRALLPVVMLAAVQGSIVGGTLLLLGRGPAEKAREAHDKQASAEAASPPSAEAAVPASAEAAVPAPAEAAAPASDEDWVPPPHAVPFGPFLALAALEFLLAREAIARLFFGVLQKLIA